MISTFKDLYEFLQKFDEDNIINWLEIKWTGKDKQESLLRLFASLDLIEKLKSFQICKGNFNEKTIVKNTTHKDIFYDASNKLKKLKDKGDSSDLTGIHKENHKHLLVTTSKNLNKIQVGKLDIEKLLNNFQQYSADNFTMSLCICIRSEDNFQKMKSGIEKTNKELKTFLEKEDTIVINWCDLNQAYHQFKKYFGNKSLNSIINLNQKTLCLKMHQHLGVMKTLRLKKCEKKKILWGHIQRSGKSYIIGGCIIEDSKDKDECNYLVITTAPRETIVQQRKVFDCIQLNDFNIIVLNGKNKKPDLKKKNIILCSKQFLQTKIEKNHKKQTKEKTKSINWLKKMSFDMRFLDESHNGGTTELAQKTLKFYGATAFTVQITATYSKPVNNYNIPKDCWVLWDLEDIKLCKNIKDKDSIDILAQKHGNNIYEILQKEIYSYENIINEYSKYPNLVPLTHKIKPAFEYEITDDTQHTNYGWSPDACFLLKQSIKRDKRNKYAENKKFKLITKEEFQNEPENLKLWYNIFGKKNKYGIPDKKYPDDIVFMKRIEKICDNQGSRFIGKKEFHNEPMIILAFLPVYTDRGKGNLIKISNATIKLLKDHNVIPDYEIISINDDGGGKKDIEDARVKARNSNKKGVLVLSGTKCGLGVSIDNCDIVLLLNNIMGFDMIYQMMFRCMTEGKNKKYGFVVDLNIHRVVKTSIINYASLIKPDIHPREATKFLLQERLINLNADHWMPSFGNDISNINTLCENVYDIYSLHFSGALENELNKFNLKKELFSKMEYELFNTIFKNIKLSKQKHKELFDHIEKELKNKETTLKKGIEKIEVEDFDKENDISEINEEITKIKPFDILKPVSILISLLTIHDCDATTLDDMYNNLIKIDINKKNILLNQIRMCWGKNITNEQIKALIKIFIEYTKNDRETEQLIRTIKELFCKNRHNMKELSKVIDKYLIPQKLEKKSNAEVSTPFKLRQQMLDKMPLEFWTSLKKVFEPCAGKGGFIIDIIDRFMDGLKEAIPDEKLRYKTIVEKCLYFSDINATNIFICKILIDPCNEYNLNYNDGNTLELDIKEKWDIDGFDAVIGNPPYQNSNNNKGSGNTLWNLFVEKSLNVWLIEKGLLLYVHPRGWRQIKSKVGNLMKEKQIIYLNMNSVSKGLEIFKCATDYDYYLIENIYAYKKTYIDDYENKKYEYMINNDLKFIPNHNLNEVFSLVDIVDDNGFINDQSSYEPRKKWMSKNQSNEYKYPCVYSINSKNVISKKWSSRNDKGHFHITKFIFSNGNGSYKDINGDYGLTQWAYAIKCKKEDIDNVEKAFNSNKFNNIIDAINLTSNKYNYNVMKLFKKDFWKEFI